MDCCLDRQRDERGKQRKYSVLVTLEGEKEGSHSSLHTRTLTLSTLTLAIRTLLASLALHVEQYNTHNTHMHADRSGQGPSAKREQASEDRVRQMEKRRNSKQRYFTSSAEAGILEQVRNST